MEYTETMNGTKHSMGLFDVLAKTTVGHARKTFKETSRAKNYSQDLTKSKKINKK